MEEWPLVEWKRMPDFLVAQAVQEKVVAFFSLLQKNWRQCFFYPLCGMIMKGEELRGRDRVIAERKMSGGGTQKVERENCEEEEVRGERDRLTLKRE